jgi:hypothetical protein
MVPSGDADPISVFKEKENIGTWAFKDPLLKGIWHHMFEIICVFTR